jgi:hypothetical protein
MVDVPEGAAVLTGTFSIRDHPVKILFDSGATHSFINESLVCKLGLHSCHTKESFVVSTAGGKIPSNTITKAVPLQLGSMLTDKTLIHLRSASVRTYTFFTMGFPRFLSIRGARGLLALNQVLI